MLYSFILSTCDPPVCIIRLYMGLEGLIVLRDFDLNKITERYSEDLRKELTRLECFKLQTVLKSGPEDEKYEGM